MKIVSTTVCLLWLIASTSAFGQTTQPADRPATQPATQPVAVGPAVKLPYSVERFVREGPVAGVVVKIDLADPRVKVKVAVSDPKDPDGEGPAVGRLDTTSGAAARHDFEITMNASFFATTSNRTILGKKVGYFVGNGGFPVGWHYSDGRIVSKPAKDGPRATVVVHKDGRITLEAALTEMPADVQFAVSGNAKMLTAGQVTPPEKDTARHPRSAVGLSEDGKTLLLMVVDGRRPAYSRGTTLAETAELLKEFGAAEGINLDGGGSTALVIKDLVTGAFGVINRPSEILSLAPAADSMQRPVIDVVGVDIEDPEIAAAPK